MYNWNSFYLDHNIKNDDIFIEGYHKEPFRKDRNSSGGGVIVYISDLLQAKRRSNLDFEGEVIWVEIEFPLYKLLVCVVYRPPGDDYPFWDNLQQSVENALNYSPYVLITVDRNVDFLTDFSHRVLDLMRLNQWRSQAILKWKQEVWERSPPEADEVWG